jgi:uncharacterized repeat protein (TIGR01451 family)
VSRFGLRVRSAGVGFALFCGLAAAASGAPASLAEVSAKMPLRFEENVGQLREAGVRYFAQGKGYRLLLSAGEAELRLDGAEAPETVRLRLAGGAGEPALAGVDPLPTKTHYLLGRDPRGWHTGVANFAAVRYQNVYPGTDMVFAGNERRVEQTFYLAAGAEPRRIRMVYEGAAQAEVGKGGELILHTQKGGLTADRPVAYQTVRGQRRPVECRYALLSQGTGAPAVGFVLGKYDRKRPLVIDPVFSNSTFLGGADGENGNAVGIDGSGNIYIAGGTISTNFPATSGSAQTSNGGPVGAEAWDGFIAKIDPTGTTLLYATYLGGSGSDEVNGIAVDAAGNAYLTGYTYSTDFPGVTGGSIQSAYAGERDAFLAKLNAAGSALIYSTYLGGAVTDHGKGVAIDASGNAYVTGFTGSDDFPVTVGAFQTSFAGAVSDAFVTKVDSTGSAVVYSTFLGTSDEDAANGIAVDTAGGAYVAGTTCSTSFPVTAGALETVSPGADCDNGLFDAFVTKLNAAGTALAYSTYLGGEKYDAANGLAVDADGKAYVTGVTTSTSFTGVDGSSYQPGNPFQGTGAFLTKIDAAGDAVSYSTFLGGLGDGETSGQGVTVDAAGNAYVTGIVTVVDAHEEIPIANATTLQTSPGSLEPDGFVTKFDATGFVVLSTFFGGRDADAGSAIAVDSSRNAIYVAGSSSSTAPPGDTSGSLQRTNSGNGDALLIRIVPGAYLTLDKTDDAATSVNPGDKITYTLAYQNIGDADGVGATLTETVPANTTFKAASSTPGWSCTPNDDAGSTCTLALGTVAVSESGLATFAVKVKAKLAAGDSTIHNTACAHPGPICASEHTGTTAAPVLSITKTAQFTVAKPGNVLSYKIKYSNSGNQDATPVFLTDTVPGNTTFNPGASTAGWTCSPNNSAGSVCTFPLGTLAAGTNGTAIFAVSLSTLISNTACIETDVPAPELAGSRTGKSITPVACSTATTPLN